MSSEDQPPADKSERQRKENLSEQQAREMELAGGVEGGMPAGSAGGPSEEDAQRPDGARYDSANDNG